MSEQKSPQKGYPVKVTLHIVMGTDGGDQTLLPTRQAIEKNLRQAKINLRIAQGEQSESATEAQATLINQRLWLCRNQKAVAEQDMEDFDAAMARAKATVYTINTPDYGECLELEDAHRIDEKGMPRTDMAKLHQTITSSDEFIQGIPDPTVVRPTHMRRLWESWVQAVYPDPQEIPTLSTPSSMPSPAS
jgi:hypothetical protein